MVIKCNSLTVNYCSTDRSKGQKKKEKVFIDNDNDLFVHIFRII